MNSLPGDAAAKLPDATGSAPSEWGTLGVPLSDQPLSHLLVIAAADGVTLRHAHYPTGARVPMHRHDVHAFVYGVGGPCMEQAEGALRSRRRLTFHPAGYEHSLVYRGPTNVTTIELDPGLFDPKLRRSLPRLSTPLPATSYNDWWTAVLRLAGNGDRQAEYVEALARGACAWSNRARPDWLMTTIDRIHQDWRNVPRASELAAAVGVSAPHMCRAFKRHTGVTLQQYGVLARLDRARGLLWASPMPISAIAAETGFSDQSHLTRAISAYSDITPARLRAAAPCLRPRSGAGPKSPVTIS